MKNKVALLWGITGICLICTVGLWFMMNKAELSYEEVSAVVTKAESKQTIDKTVIYEVEVLYDGEAYDLQNVYGLAGYYEGAKVQAFLSNGQLYANVAGVKTSTSIATVYFTFLFGTYVMVMISAIYMSKVKNKNK